MQQSFVPVTTHKESHSSTSSEELFVFTRTHWLEPFQAIFGIFLFGFILLLFFFILFFNFLSSPLSFGLLFLMGSNIGLLCVVKVIVDWHLHYYVITAKKISEIRYIPLITHSVNDVLMDRVKCTEVDVKTDGILQHLLEIGTVTVTFDRPTHEPAFIFWNVKNANAIGNLLANKLVEVPRPEMTIWHKIRGKTSGFYTTEEIFPRVQLQ